MWIDFHTHQLTNHHFALYNAKIPETPKGIAHSVGIHPWWIQPEALPQQYEWVTQHLHEATAIGECGLDKRGAVDFETQRMVARWHIEMAALHCKPVILHCVKAYNEMQQIIAEMRPGVPIMFHGFRGSLQLMDDLCRKGYFLGVGPIANQEAFRTMVQHMPLSNMTLETDDGAAPIEFVYQQVATIKEIAIEELVMAMKQNALSIFGAKFSDYDGS
jgi:TatD DNase family protein